MSGSTGRLALSTIDNIGDDLVSVFRTAINNHASKLDASVMYLSGLLSGLPSAGLAGRMYLASDAPGLLFLDSGTTWLPLAQTLRRVVATGTHSASPGEFVICTGTSSFTVQLPDPATGEIQVMNATTGGATITVSQPGGGIYGAGSDGVGSILLVKPYWPATFTANDGSGYLVTDWIDGLASPWVALTSLNANVTALGRAQSRLTAGGVVELRGALFNSGSSVAANTSLAVLAAASQYPPSNANLITLISSSTPALLSISATGHLTLDQTLPSSNVVFLDGLSFAP